MSRFEGLDPDVIGIVLIGAEGCAETADENWLRDATAEEREFFIQHCKQLVAETKGPDASKSFDFTEFTVDTIGRPYFLKAVLDSPETPRLAREKAIQFTRVVRIDSV
jgi:hypothetical protein